MFRVLVFCKAQGAAKIESLQHVNTQLQTGKGFLLLFDTFGDGQCTDTVGQQDQRLADLLLVIAPVDTADQGAVDLDDVRLQKGYPFQIGMSGPHIIQGNQKSPVPVMVNEVRESVDILDPGFNDLQDNLVGGYPSFEYRLIQKTDVIEPPFNHFSGNIQEQQGSRGASFRQRGVALNRCTEGMAVQLGKAAVIPGPSEELLRLNLFR